MSEHDFVKQAFPEAKNITFASECPDCKAPTLYFFTLENEPKERDINGEIYLEGGFYCWACQFGNAGCILK